LCTEEESKTANSFKPKQHSLFYIPEVKPFFDFTFACDPVGTKPEPDPNIKVITTTGLNIFLKLETV
jgi:hypothetical protein